MQQGSKVKLEHIFNFKTGGTMKKTNVLLLIIAMLVFGSGITAFAQTITIRAVLDRGVSLPTTATILNCPGTMLSTDNPFTVCTAATSVDFSTLAHTFTDGSQAGCFFSPRFFMVFLYPAVWGGAGFTINQTFTWTTGTLPTNAVVLSPVYSSDDRGTPTGPIQGPRPTGTTLGSATAATGGAKLIYSAPAPAESRIIRALYSIPPNPGPGQSIPYSGWTALPLTTVSGTRTGNAVFTITQL